jgi:hypothetical protein
MRHRRGMKKKKSVTGKDRRNRSRLYLNVIFAAANEERGYIVNGPV